MCDAKLEENADFLEGREALQGYLDRCECWSITNRMKFNEHKCQILLLGQRNPGCTCRLGDEVGMQPCRSGGFWLMVRSAWAKDTSWWRKGHQLYPHHTASNLRDLHELSVTCCLYASIYRALESLCYRS